MNKPFDLQKALAGEPVATEGDTGYYQFTLASNARSDDHRHVFKMRAHEDLEPHEYVVISDDFGDVISGHTGQDFEKLTMAPVKVKYYYASWRNANNSKPGRYTTNMYDSEDKLMNTDRMIGTKGTDYLIHEIEIEE